MEIDLDLGQWIVIGLSVFLFCWYFIFMIMNRKKGLDIYRWLRQGLDVMGKITTAEWIGASNMGGRLVVKNATKPFHRIEAIYLLEPREFLPYWIFSRLRGKREAVVIKVVFHSPPKGNLEIKRTPVYKAKKLPENQQFHKEFQIVLADRNADRFFLGVEQFLAENGSLVERVMVHPQAPHLEIHARLRPLLQTSSATFFNSLLACFKP